MKEWLVDSFELNKIIGAVLASVLAVLVINHVGNALIQPNVVVVKGYKVEGVDVESNSLQITEVEVEDPQVASLLGSASLDAGKKQAVKCAACHDLTKGGPAKIGPNLYGILGDNFAHMAGFAYSDVIKKHGGKWDYDSLYVFLKNPQAYLPGTKMSFAGIKKPQDRANLIFYLRSLSDNPLPLPALPAAK